MYPGIFRYPAAEYAGGTLRISLLFVPVLVLACGSASARAQITAAAAANVQFALEDLRADFQRASGLEVKAVYGSSGKLAAQIGNGAPFDLFISADMEFPDSLHAWGYAPARPRPYAFGKLVLWTARDLDLSRGLALLGDSALGRIALADPRRAPYGREAVKALRRAGLYDRVKGRIVLGESIGQVNQYILTGTVDIGFTAKSIVLAPDMKSEGKWAEVDGSAYDPIAQGAVLTRYGSENHPAASARFLDYLYSPPARKILAGYGYALP